MLIALFVMICGYLYLLIKKFKNYKKERLVVVTLLYFYAWLILFLTIIPKQFAINPYWRETNLINYPYDNFKPFFDFKLNRPGSLQDIILNLLMMMPFGFLFTAYFKKGIITVTSATLLFSMFIEITQLILTKFLVHQRSFDVTDIINNTIGGIVGYIIYKIIYKKVKKT